MKLFIPGPTEVHPDVMQAMTHEQIGHRTDVLRDLVGEINPKLQTLFGTTGDVFVATCSATGALEATLRNTVRKKILSLQCGAWSKKWGDMAEANGFDVVRQDVPLGHGNDPDDVRAALSGGEFDAVTMVWSETSTGVLNHLADIAAVVREFDDVLLLVDAVSALAAVECDVDSLGVDVCVAGVQKAMAMPPGIAVLSVSAAALARAESIPVRGYYMDFLRHKANADRNETPSTPSTPHLWALNEGLDRILGEGMNNRAMRHERMASMCHAWARERMGIFPSEEFLSPSLSCISNPNEIDMKSFLAQVKEKGFQLGSGYGELKGKTFRIGHFGEHTEEDVASLIEAMDASLPQG